MCKPSYILVLVFFTLLQNASAVPVEDFNLIRLLPHTGRGEGLDYNKSYLWEAEGDKKIIKKISPTTGRVVRTYSSPTLYPESIMWMESDKFLHIDFKRTDVVIGQIGSNGVVRLELLGHLKTLGFGLAKKTATSFWVSGYFSSEIYLYSYPGLRLLRTITTPLRGVEDLAWDGKHLWASDYYDLNKKLVYRLDPDDGDVVGTYKLPGSRTCERVDGIALRNDEIFVTGKNCGLYVVEKPELLY
ncbi:MAG TPA: hypothetical protein VNJ01_00305 [Bacteriovoracaceae bacterium]|nr:hypothetical protein [Bacteriovoracaceae bacterium]